MAENDAGSDIADEELFARAEAALDTVRARWYETYCEWRGSEGNHAVGSELSKVTSLYLTELMIRSPRDHLMLRYLAQKLKSASARYPDFWRSDYSEGGRIWPENVQRAILEAVRYILRFKHDEEQLSKAKSLVAGLYGVNSRTVNNWLNKFHDAEPSEKVFLKLDEVNLEYYAQDYRLWKSSVEDRRAGQEEN
jgi:hypothetical protein